MAQMVLKHIYLSGGQVDFLEGLDGLSVSEHIRRAIDDYIQKKRERNVATSPSKKGVLSNG